MRRSIVVMCLVTAMSVSGQSGKYSLGARNAGIGGASITLGDQWGIFNNAGALARATKSTAFTSYKNKFNISEFQVLGAGYIHKLESTVLGVGFFRFGDQLFSEQRINLSIGHKLDLVSLGISIDYLQYNIATVGKKGAVLFEFGGVAEITDQIFFGAHIFNVDQAKLSTQEGEKLPTVMKAGISFRPTTQLMINFETEKDLGYEEIFRVGLEYQIVENVLLRTGFNTAPFKGAFGFGFNPKKMQLDYSFSDDTNLGSIHEISLSYLLNSE